MIYSQPTNFKPNGNASAKAEGQNPGFASPLLFRLRRGFWWVAETSFKWENTCEHVPRLRFQRKLIEQGSKKAKGPPILAAPWIDICMKESWRVVDLP